MKKGFTVVMEGQRINLRVYRRFFYPINIKHLNQQFIVYSDTKREREINYNRAEDYDLDDPFKRISLIRLARAMNCLRISDIDENEYNITICTSRELYEPDTYEVRYIPIDPRRLEPLEEKIKKERRKIDWIKRIKPYHLAC
jgi:hypothetical protein